MTLRFWTMRGSSIRTTLRWQEGQGYLRTIPSSTPILSRTRSVSASRALSGGSAELCQKAPTGRESSKRTFILVRIGRPPDAQNLVQYWLSSGGSSLYHSRGKDVLRSVREEDQVTCRSAYKDAPVKGLNLLQLLCKYGHHNIETSTSGMACRCTRKGCGYYWEYD